ncbi:hypothetical protein C9374_004174 [Naegleria lovaniensis]|uniref:Piwi domain-containing protein n=1 Tax=Naegleria lovaniensis TaxID=51637 RepID=A0AA88GST1_NAELO|nr:uncharacterized protein C9374_004174 [Naegleria lovaniensis]KAG2383503.1 hypothetical protein C9374_004174 [Naegleria lovaniensis]
MGGFRIPKRKPSTNEGSSQSNPSSSHSLPETSESVRPSYDERHPRYDRPSSSPFHQQQPQGSSSFRAHHQQYHPNVRSREDDRRVQCDSSYPSSSRPDPRGYTSLTPMDMTMISLQIDHLHPLLKLLLLLAVVLDIVMTIDSIINKHMVNQGMRILEDRTQKDPLQQSEIKCLFFLFSTVKQNERKILTSNFYGIQQQLAKNNSSSSNGSLIMYQLYVKNKSLQEREGIQNVNDCLERNPYRLNTLFRQMVKGKTQKGSLLPFLSGTTIVSNIPLLEQDVSMKSELLRIRKKNRQTLEFYEDEYEVTMTKIDSSQNMTALSQILSLLVKFAAQFKMGMIPFGPTLCFNTPERRSDVRDYDIYKGFNFAMNALKGVNNRAAGIYLSLSFKQKVVARENLWECILDMKRTGKHVEVILSELIGRSVQYKGKTYVIRDIDFQKNPNSTFPKRDKNSKVPGATVDISFLDHVVERYQFANQKKEVNYLIPQLCFLTGAKKREDISKFLGLFDRKQKQQTISTIVNELSIRKEAGKFLRDQAGITIEDTPLQVTGEPLDIPLKEKSYQTIRNQPFEYVFMIPNKEACKTLQSIFVGNYKELKYERLDDISNLARKNSDRYKNHKWISVLPPTKDATVYNSLKSILIEKGITSQCLVLDQNIQKKKKAIENQVLCKSNVVPWTLRYDFASLTVCGICVEGMGKSRTGAVMMSNNKELTGFSSQTFKCERNELQMHLFQSLRDVMDLRKDPIEHMIMYVMGVQNISETTLEEWKQLFPQLCVILVNKDTPARFSTHGKLPSSLLVDELQRENFVYEFYLTTVSEKPVNYMILYNSIGYDNKSLATITNNQTFLYFNFENQIRLPACLMYAKKAAEMRSKTSTQESEKLQNTFYFL